MKKTIITQATWALLITGSIMFGACKNNNNGSIAQNTDTAVATPLYGNLDTNNTATGTALNNNGVSPDTGLTASTTGVTPTNANRRSGPAQRIASHRYAYVNRHRSYRKKTRTTTNREESTLAISDNQPQPVRHEEDVVNIDKPAEQPALETQNEFLGNQPTTTSVKKIRIIHFAPEVGGNLNNLYRLADDFQTSNMLKVGFNAGIAMNIRLGNRLALEPALRYIMKGSEIESSSSDAINSMEEKDKLTFHYLEYPLNLVYNFGDWGKGRFMIGAGPYVSYLLNAQDKSTITTTNIYEGTTVSEGQHSLPVGNPNTLGNVRNWDAGAGAFIGYQMAGGTYVKAGAEVGLLDLQKNTNTLGNFYDRNYNFLLSVGYMIGYNK